MATPAIDRTKNFVLNNEWEEVYSSGLVSIVLVSGRSFWAYNGPSAPPAATKLKDYVPLTGDFGQAVYAYGGTQKTFCRIAGPDISPGTEESTGLGLKIEISVTPII